MQEFEAINEIIKKYRENKLAHAYLVETNNIELAVDTIKELIKTLNCENEYQKSCSKCNLCNLINKNSLPSLKIIEPEGTSIKKNQIETLKNNFETMPVYSKYNIYIIKNAEKLNSSSANSMLKFVEEPTDGIIGFFITTNKELVIDTIKSRCQSINLKYRSKNIIESLNLNEENIQKYSELIKNYLTKIDNISFINNKKDVLSILSERTEIANMFQIILEIYYSSYLKLLNKEYDQEIIKIYKVKDNLSVINKKIQIIAKILNDLSYNVNIELILDKFVIEMRGTNG